MSRFSLLIPTRNRPDAVIRQISFYAANTFPGEVLIGDASDAPAAADLAAVIDRLNAGRWVKQLAWSGLGIGATLKRLSEIVQTPYAAFCGDDDLLIPSGISRCMDALDTDPSIVAASGRAYVFEVESGAMHGVPRFRERYPMTQADGATAAERLLHHMRHYSVSLFSVHRADVWQQMWRDIDPAGEFSFMNELLPCCLSVVAGQARSLNCVYALRQDHPIRVAAPNAEEWVRDPKWKSSAEHFTGIVAKAVAARDAIDQPRARVIVDEALDAYLQYIHGLSPPRRLRTALLRPLRALRTALVRKRREVSVTAIQDELRVAAAGQPDVGRLLEHFIKPLQGSIPVTRIHV